jgi:hypothetical protein
MGRIVVGRLGKLLGRRAVEISVPSYYFGNSRSYDVSVSTRALHRYEEERVSWAVLLSAWRKCRDDIHLEEVELEIHNIYYETSQHSAME